MKILVAMIVFLFEGVVWGGFKQQQLRSIDCRDHHGNTMVLRPVSLEMLAKAAIADESVVFQIQVDEALSTGYYGAIAPEENRWVQLDLRQSDQSTTVLSDWDRSLGITVQLPYGVIENDPAFDHSSFTAVLMVEYLDLTEDFVRSKLECRKT